MTSEAQQLSNKEVDDIGNQANYKYEREMRSLRYRLEEHAKHMSKLASHPSSWELYTHDYDDPKIILPASGLEHLTRDTFYALIMLCHYTAYRNGFWGDNASPEDKERRNIGEAICLMHSELSEALEASRVNNKENLTEEFADVIIRIFDFCGGNNLQLATALLEKMEKNARRPYKHGKEF